MGGSLLLPNRAKFYDVMYTRIFFNDCGCFYSLSDVMVYLD
jgi:hypothetical protein